MPRLLPAILFLGMFLAASAWGQDPDVRIAGTISTKPLLSELVRVMKDSKGLRLAVTSDFTSADAVEALATEKVNIAIITKPISGEERSNYPDVNLLSIPLGMEVIAIGVSDDLWDAGVHSISRETMRAIYEQKITNWKQAGGPDEKITFFNFQQGLGIWEIFAEWLYDDNRKAPIPKTDKVNSSEDARDSLEFTHGSIAPLAAPLADGARCHALGIEIKGRTVKPASADVAAKAYPLVRPLIAVVVGRPSLAIRVVTDFLTGPDGQALVKKYGALGVDAVPKPSPNPYF